MSEYDNRIREFEYRKVGISKESQEYLYLTRCSSLLRNKRLVCWPIILSRAFLYYLSDPARNRRRCETSSGCAPVEWKGTKHRPFYPSLITLLLLSETTRCSRPSNFSNPTEVDRPFPSPVRHSLSFNISLFSPHSTLIPFLVDCATSLSLSLLSAFFRSISRLPRHGRKSAIRRQRLWCLRSTETDRRKKEQAMILSDSGALNALTLPFFFFNYRDIVDFLRIL